MGLTQQSVLLMSHGGGPTLLTWFAYCPLCHFAFYNQYLIGQYKLAGVTFHLSHKKSNGPFRLGLVQVIATNFVKTSCIGLAQSILNNWFQSTAMLLSGSV